MAGTLIATFAFPGVARASSLNLSSSMSGFCIGSDCSIVRFVVDLNNANAWIDGVRIFSNNQDKWQFGALWGANNALGMAMGWSTATSGGDHLFLRSPGPIGSDPIYLTVGMAKWSSESELFDGTLAFSGEGIASSPRDVDVQGTVSPEPASMVLLGTGLMGVVGAARRRRVAKMTDV